MQLVAILSALTAAAGITNAAPTSATSDAANRTQDDRYLWSIMGYANPGCQGPVVWYGTDTQAQFCHGVPEMAASFLWGAMTGVQFITSPVRGVCDYTPALGGEGDGVTVTTVTTVPAGRRRVGCQDGLIQAYSVTYLPWLCC